MTNDWKDSLDKQAAQTAAHEEQERQNKVNRERIKQLIVRLVDLEMDIDVDHFAEKKVIEKELRTLGPGPTEINKRIFDEVCSRLGVANSTVGGNKVRTVSKNKFRRSPFAKKEVSPLVPGFIADKRDAVFYGESGAGKSVLTLQMIKSMIEEYPFGDQTTPSSAKGKKVLWIGPDGSVNALDTTTETLEKMEVLDDDRFLDAVDFWLEDPEEGTASWNLSTGNLVKLQQAAASGEYGLVVIDSLKASCTGTRWSIDERIIADVMRLVQALVCKHAALVWIHHSNKGRSTGSNKAAGCTDIIEVVSAAVEFKQEWSDDRTSKRDYVIVQKFRGSSMRQFDYQFSWQNIVAINADASDKADNAITSSDPLTAVLICLRDSEKPAMKAAAIADKLGIKNNTVSKHLSKLKSLGYVRDKAQAWTLTSNGWDQAHMCGNASLLKYVGPTDF